MHVRLLRNTHRAFRMSPPPAFTDAAETWNRRYAGDDFLFGTEPNAWLREHVGSLPGAGRILSVADGEGRNSVWLAQQGFQVDAFDVASRAVEKARAFAQRQGVSVNFSVADVDGFAWPEAAYDGVAAIFVQFADPDTRARLFARIVRSLKPGGVLVLQGYTPKQLEYRTGGPPILSHLYTRELLASAFEDLSIIELRTYEAEVHEGQGHSGRSALIGLVARR
jgi:SAM-dependent methyltransferase